MDSMKNIMQYNAYSTDPYSDGLAGMSICSRADLQKEHPKNEPPNFFNPGLGGSIDAKVTNFAMASRWA